MGLGWAGLGGAIGLDRPTPAKPTSPRGLPAGLPCCAAALSVLRALRFATSGSRQSSRAVRVQRHRARPARGGVLRKAPVLRFNSRPQCMESQQPGFWLGSARQDPAGRRPGQVQLGNERHGAGKARCGLRARLNSAQTAARLGLEAPAKWRCRYVGLAKPGRALLASLPRPSGCCRASLWGQPQPDGHGEPASQPGVPFPSPPGHKAVAGLGCRAAG